MRSGLGRGELWFRLIFSCAGLAFLAGAIFLRGIGGIASAEIVLIGLAFFGASALWSARRLWPRR